MLKEIYVEYNNLSYISFEKMVKLDLTKIGLTNSESIIYQSILLLGNCSVRDISKHCGFHRTNIYDILEQLKEKGLITFSKEGKSMTYQIADPEDLYEFIEEKRRHLDEIIPHILELKQQEKDNVKVNVFKGEDGMKAAFRDILKDKKDVYRFGAEGLLRKNFPKFAEYWLTTLKKNKKKYIGIYTKRDILPSHFTEIKYLPPEYRNPASIIIYGEKININIWEPMFISIVIESKIVAKSYMQYFNLLWKIAKK